MQSRPAGGTYKSPIPNPLPPQTGPISAIAHKYTSRYHGRREEQPQNPSGNQEHGCGRRGPRAEAIPWLPAPDEGGGEEQASGKSQKR